MNDASHGAGKLPEQGTSVQRGSRIRGRSQPRPGSRMAHALTPVSAEAVPRLENRASSKMTEETAEEAEIIMTESRRLSTSTTSPITGSVSSAELPDEASLSSNRLHDHTGTFEPVVLAFLEQARARNRALLAAISPKSGSASIAMEDHTAMFERAIKRHRPNLGLPPKR